ncbi:MAG TPA: UDP-N-acetylmuramoyl-L-alanyl-D-glutamate--2,6-diaminopimelate ligase [Blastocatellia bacterium]|nr:UDP-N-acetylmuramoyl-L-alanyl-D-glutamate--2,6-diaminopimelate ligase [Blastocatellia bacterium]
MTRIREIASYLNAIASGGHTEGVVNATDSSVTNDSRRVVPGGVFVAIKGAQVDGNRFIKEAVKRGAVAIISEESRPMEGSTDSEVVWLQVEDARAALARAASLVHGSPSSALKLVGLTGTNGKTTTAHLVESIFEAAGEKSAMMGTIGYYIGEQKFEAEFTTPEASEIQAFLRRAVDAGVRYAVMEVSSIALEMHRADELEFAVAAFTNLTQDHLDFHGTMESYAAAKRKLFDGSLGRRPGWSVVNGDDPLGAELKRDLPGKVLTYGLDSQAEIMPSDREVVHNFGLEGLQFTARTPIGAIEVDSRLVGRPHAYNVLCAIGVGVALGFDREVIARGIRRCTGVAGRFERVNEAGDDITVVVDYAHTPDALVNVLNTICDVQKKKNGKRGRVITVMGCGGDRDRTKRPIMGEESARLSDLVIATSDNPRSEDPLLILNDIRVGLGRVGKPYELIVDRHQAIQRAIAQAKPGDVVLIAGKGHETYQILATGKIHFDDREVAREALQVRNAGYGWRNSLSKRSAAGKRKSEASAGQSGDRPLSSGREEE